MPVDSFRFLPRILALYYQSLDRTPELPIPWTRLPRPLKACKFGLVTSGGLYQAGVEPPFDLDREREQPTWGDPSYRVIPSDIDQAQVAVSHLHINPADVVRDFNILLPLQRFRELVEEGRVGGLAEQAYSFMGFQGFPPDTSAWEERYGPQVADRFKSEAVDCVLLTPA